MESSHDQCMLDRYAIAISYGYLVLPTLLFVLGWLAWYIAVPVVGIVVLSTLLCLKSFTYIKMPTINFRAVPTLLLFVIALFLIVAWVVLSGIGGYMFQNSDLHWRNAILRDLITYQWPVVYQTTDISQTPAILDYYLAFWLPAALVGKIFGWYAANFALFLWTVLGVFIVAYLLMRFIQKFSVWPIVILILFSGMDIVRFWYLNRHLPAITKHIEWNNIGGIYSQFSSTTTQLFWVFNQALPAWVATMLLLSLKNNKNLMFTWALCLPFAPLPAIGLFAFAVVKGLSCEIARGKTALQTFIKSIGRNVMQAMTWQNLLGGVVIAGILALYFSVNVQGGKHYWRFNINNINDKLLLHLLFLYGLEFLPIMWCIKKKYVRDPIFYAILISLLVIPWYRIGSFNDFTMRGSIPALLILCAYVIKYFQDEFSFKNLYCYVLIAVLLIGAFTPRAEMMRSILSTEKGVTWADAVRSIGNGPSSEGRTKSASPANFVSTQYTDSFFYKYLMKK